jgi:hypothetical protein
MNLNYLFEMGDGSGEFGELERILPKKTPQLTNGKSGTNNQGASTTPISTLSLPPSG